MTRDEALQKINRLPIGPSCGEGPWLLDALETLGLISFDKSKPEGVLLFDAICHTSLEGKLDKILAAIDAAGLRLVRK